MLKNTIFMTLIAIAVAGTPAALGAQSWETALPGALDKMASNYFQPSIQAAFGTFTFAYTDLPSPFSRWLEENLADAMAKSGKLRLFNRAAAAAMDPAFKAIYGDFFKNNGVDGLVYGRYFDEGDSIRTRIELTAMTDGVLIGTTEIRIPKKALPPGLAVDPSKAVTQAAANLVQVLPAASPVSAGVEALTVSVSTERGKGAVYREGEDMVILVTVSKEAYLKVYHVDVNGTVQLIWPNRFGGGGTIGPGQAVRIPGPGDPFAFRMTPPFGTEFIKVVASTKAFASTEADFTSLGSDARGAITRGLSLIGTGSAAGQKPGSASAQAGSAGITPGGAMAEAMASYVIMEASK